MTPKRITDGPMTQFRLNKKQDAMTTHTPGPWKLEHEQGDEQVTEHFVLYGDCKNSHGADEIATIYGEANARLIAAAPELLEALELASQALAGDPDEDTYVKIQAALARARVS